MGRATSLTDWGAAWSVTTSSRVPVRVPPGLQVGCPGRPGHRRQQCHGVYAALAAGDRDSDPAAVPPSQWQQAICTVFSWLIIYVRAPGPDPHITTN